MYRSIVVPIDSSSLSETALPIAISIARRHPGTAVEAVTVAPPPIDPLGRSGAPVPDSRLDDDMRRETHDFVTTLSERLAAMAPDLSTSATMLDGPIADSIGAHVQRAGAGLVVMTTHGRSGFSRLWLGSVADRLVRHSTVPVLLLKDISSGTSAEGEAPFREVLVPVDVSVDSESIVEDAITLAGPEATYHLLHVVVPMRRMPPSALDAIALSEGAWDTPADLLGATRDSAAKHVEKLAERLRQQGVRVTTRVQIHPRPAEEILTYAKERQVQLICMASHGRGPAGRVMLGSVSDKVVRGATVPVLLRVPSARKELPPGGIPT